MLINSQQLLLNSIRSLQTTQDYSDLRIICGDRVFNVHKAVVCPRFTWFTNTCNWPKNGEAKDEIDLLDDDPRLVGLMVDYMYQLDYNDTVEDKPPPTLQFEGDKDKLPNTTVMTEVPPGVETSSVLEPTPVVEVEDEWSWPSRISNKKDKKKKPKSSPPCTLRDIEDVETHKLTINTLMYALAEKYMIEDLKLVAMSKFKAAVETGWQTKAFPHAAKLVFETTPNSDTGLRKVVIDSFDQYPELVDYEEIQNLLNTGNGIARGFTKVLLNRLEPHRSRKWWC